MGRARSPLAMLATATVVTAVTAVVLPLSTADLASPALAAAGNPGIPGAPTVLYQEGFENSGPQTSLLTDYVGSTGATYTADPYWLNPKFCNGFILDFNDADIPPGYCSSYNDFTAYDYGATRAKAYALGLLNSPQNPESNRAVSTNTSPQSQNQTITPNQIEFETSRQLALPSANGRFVTFSVGAAATACGNNDPLLRFYFRTASGTEIPVSTAPIDPCTSPGSQTTSVNLTTGGSPQSYQVGYGQFPANGSILLNSPSIGIVLRNESNATSGNDGAFDNIQVLDVTPQLDKAFSPSTIHPGQTSTLTFTITNTSELAAKNGWSFTDNLPAGVSVANPTAATTTCTGGAVAATTGGTSLQVTGNLNAGQASCTASVQVTATVVGSYTNGPGNVTSTGLNPPGPTTLNVIPTPTITVVKNVAGRADTSDQFTVGLNTAAGATLASATTTGTATTVSTAATPVADNTAYTVTDTTTAASADPISAYNTAISCTNTATGTSVPTTGNGPTWTVTSTNSDPITCTVTNTAQARSFSVVKSASETVAKPGDTVTYSVKVTNTGPVAYTAANPASFTDNLTGVLDDATYNDASATGNGGAAGTVAFGTPNLTWSGPLAVGATTTITYSVTVTDPDNGDHSLANVVTTPPNSGGGCPTGSTAAGCSTTTPVQSFRTVKTVTSPTTGAPAPGDKVTYSVLVTNTGRAAYTAANPASFTDSLTGVLDDATYNGDATVIPSAAGTGGTVTYTAPTLSWSGPLAVGASVTVTYSVTINNPDTGDKKLTNTVVTPPGSGGNCATGSTDPSCTANLPTKSFTTTKSASKTSVVPGDTVTYTVQVTNTGQVAYTTTNPATFTDNLTGVLDDAAYNGDAAITTGGGAGSGGAVTYTAPTLTWTGPLPVGATVTVTYSVTINNPDRGDKILANAITSPPGSGGSCVAGSTAPGCSTRTPVQSYSTVKTASTTSTTPGGKVTYTVTVTNTGQAAYTATDPATFTDDLSNVLDDATYNGDAAATAGTAAYAAPTLTWSGPLPIGGSVTVTYSVTVDNPGTGDAKLANTVVTPPGSGGGCAAGSTDPACTANVPVARLAIVKSANPDTVTAAGQPVRYSFLVTNTGNVTLTDITIDEGAFTGTGTLSAPACPAAAASLAPGASVTCTATYSTTQADIDAGGITNTATAGGTPPGGNPPVTSPPSTAKVPAPPAPGITVVKTADTTTITTIGQTVTYTFVVTNTGNVTLTTVKPVEGAFNGHGTLSPISCPATTTGTAALTPGEKVTCTATYTVVAADLTSGNLTNTATATGTPPGGTPPVTSPPSTVTIPPTPPTPSNPSNPGSPTGGTSRLAYTGAEVPLAVTTGAGLTLIAAGMLLIAGCRRRRA